jgi:hypothetical protein
MNVILKDTLNLIYIYIYWVMNNVFLKNMNI